MYSKLTINLERRAKQFHHNLVEYVGRWIQLISYYFNKLNMPQHEIRPGNLYITFPATLTLDTESVERLMYQFIYCQKYLCAVTEKWIHNRAQYPESHTYRL